MSRYAPDRALPPYAYVPGRHPHPTRDPRGHSYGDEEAPRELLPPERWREDEDFLHGVDLYNHGYLWEAHEVWEGLWHLARRSDPEHADCLQGLIQCAAAALKARMDQPRGVASLARLGTARLERVAAASDGAYLGIDLDAFVAAVRAWAASEPEGEEGMERRPRLELGRGAS